VLRPGDTVLVKGSRAIGLDEVADALAAGGHPRKIDGAVPVPH
jgi:hypothetical protein